MNYIKARNICCLEIRDSDDDGAVPLKVNFHSIILRPDIFVDRNQRF